MERIRNKKFISIVKTLQSHHYRYNNKLNSIQNNSVFKLDFYNNKTVKKNLGKLFKSIERNIKTTYNSNPINPTNTINTSNTINHSKSQLIHNEQHVKNPRVKRLEPLLKNYKLIVLRKKYDYYSNIFLLSIDGLFHTITEYDIKLHLKMFKIQCIDIFNKQEFYKKYNYSSRDFKKSLLDEVFSNNQNITLSMIKVYADVLSINLIYIKENKEPLYMNNFVPKRATSLIYEDDNNVYTIRKHGENPYIRGTELEVFLQYNKLLVRKQLEKMKLPQLQNITRMRNISCKKQGKTGKINKLKKELIEELCNYKN